MQIAVLGSWEKELDGRVRDLAEEVGRLVARRGDVVMTGGSTGVMEASMKGAKSAGGLTVGFVPGDRKEAYQYLGNHIDLFIMTGTSELGKLAPLIHSADGIVAIAGGAGTFIEICMAYLEDKPTVLIPVAGRTTDLIRAMTTDGFLDYRRVRRLLFAEDPREAVELLYSIV